jgi:transcriptional regulator with XRE-family HTH domain
MTKASTPLPPKRAKPPLKPRFVSLPFLKKHRKAAGLTQDELAALIDKKGQSLISQYELGDTNVPIPVAHDIAQALGISFAQLLLDPDGPESKTLGFWKRIPSRDHAMALKVAEGALTPFMSPETEIQRAPKK